MLHEMRFPAILEIEFQIFQNSRLIAFDGEMVMRLALGDQIVGQLALRQQGIGTDLLARNLDGLEQWDGGLDLVGAFGFFLFLARYRSEEHTSELQSLRHLVCRLLLEKKKQLSDEKRVVVVL